MAGTTPARQPSSKRWKLLLAHGDSRAVCTSLVRRGERVSGENDQGAGSEFDVSHLFHGHAAQLGSRFAISAKNDRDSQELTTRVREPRGEDEDFARILNFGFRSGFELHLQWKSAEQTEEVSIPLSERLGVPSNYARKQARPVESRVPAIFITTDSLDAGEVVSALSDVVLDPEEELVLQALQIIDPTIERIAPGCHLSFIPPARRCGDQIPKYN